MTKRIGPDGPHADKGVRATRRAVATGIVAAASVAACGGGGGGSSTPAPTGPTGSSPAPLPGSTSARFPLSAPTGRRYLVDANNAPFLARGDAPWQMINVLSREDAVRYLDDRASRKFNAINLQLILNREGVRPPNFYGQSPFTGAPFATPNEAYFQHADYVLQQAASRGFLIFLCAAWCGALTLDWYPLMQQAGAATLKEYGRYIGNRYRSLNNIIWMHGGDTYPPDKSLVTSIVDGIKEVDPVKLHTVHGNRSSDVLEYWGGSDGAWINVSSAYTAADDVVPLCAQQYTKPEGRPYYYIEGWYENERGATELDLRRQAYQSLLLGACGHMFGNYPMWALDSGWQNALSSNGAQHMTRVWDLFLSVRWDLLVPDLNNQFLTGGIGSGANTAVAAVASDRSFALVYTPQTRTLSVNLGGLAGPAVQARWYNPQTGAFTSAASSNPAASGNFNFTPVAGDDWVLVLQSA
ncbi:MAG: DUF4038 domain-containing protein [Hyphomonadaceae bacterium]|nr:DUF4038 domain-containing protein [Hyphomonadaceae bacterium]